MALKHSIFVLFVSLYDWYNNDRIKNCAFKQGFLLQILQSDKAFYSSMNKCLELSFVVLRERTDFNIDILIPITNM